jgi:thioredoxin reductase (NADPH)
MPDAKPLKLLVIGAGPAGLTAAIYGARAGLAPVLLAGPSPGGQLTLTSEVENFPGFRKGIRGPQLMEDMMEQARWCGAEILWESAKGIDAAQRPFAVTTDGGQTFRAHTLIYATGAAPRKLGVEGEDRYAPPNGAGVTYCAVCDGAFYKKRPVVVVGGGDAAMEEATYLSNLCSTVTLVHRREGFRASKVMLDRARARSNIRWELNQVVAEIRGDSGKKTVTAVSLKDVRDSSTKVLATEAVFIAIGHVPATEILRGLVELDPEGYIKVDEAQKTSVPGLFAAGDCHDRKYRQAVTAAGMGCKAALEAERYLTREGLG